MNAKATSARDSVPWDLVFDALEAPVLIIDCEEVLLANKAALRELNGGPSTAAPMSLAAMPGEPWSSCRDLVRLVRTRGSERDRQLREAKSGRHWSIHCRFIDPRPEANPAADGLLLLMLRETTEFHQLQDAMRRHERASWLADIVGGIAHQVNNPLFAISGSVESLKQDLAAGHQALPVLEVLEEEIGRLAGLMHGFTELGMASSSLRSRQEIAPLVTEACAHSTSKVATSSARIELNVEQGVEALLARDPFVLALSKILDNALELSPPSSTIRIVGTSSVDESRQAAAFELRVSDQGPGVPAAYRRKIFEPFFTQRPKRLGLGLTLAERVVVAHGGSLHCERSDAGAIIVLRVPVLVPASRKEEA